MAAKNGGTVRRFFLGAALAGTLLLSVSAWCVPPVFSSQFSRVRRSVPIEDRLNRKITVEFDSIHIRDVMRSISEASRVNIVIDEAVFSAEDGSLPGGLSAYVTVSLKDVPARDVIDIILRMKNLSSNVERHLVWITTPERSIRL